MPSARRYRHRLEMVLTEREWETLSSEAYSREISRAELVRRALKQYTAEACVAQVYAPPKNWRMSRASAE